MKAVGCSDLFSEMIPSQGEPWALFWTSGPNQMIIMICWYDDFLICSYVYGDDYDYMRLYDLPTVDDDTAAWVEDKEERVGKAFQKRSKMKKKTKMESTLKGNKKQIETKISQELSRLFRVDKIQFEHAY